ncbi:hypothetical protein CR513_20112, partial [Mucuna pruriens]
MENNDQTLKELATPDVVKTPYKHLKEFHVVCSTMRPQGILEDYIKMKAFPFSLDGVAKDWLYLQQVLFNTWGHMKCMFLEKFFPASRMTTTRKEIYGIRQHTRETLHEHWERFNKLCATCLHHHISERLLIQYFYKGLTMMDKSMIDATSGRALMDKMPTTIGHLICNMASNTQQFGIRGVSPSWMTGKSIDRINISSEATRCWTTSTKHSSQSLWYLYFRGAPTDMCPTLQETELDHPESPFRLRPSQGPYTTQQFRPALNVSQGQTSYRQPSPQHQAPPFQQQQQQRVSAQGNSPSLKDLMKQLATSNLEFHQNMNSSNIQFQ